MHATPLNNAAPESKRASGAERESTTTADAEAVELRLLIQGEQVTALAALVANLLRAQAQPPGSESWPEWMNIATAASYLDCTPERVRKLVARREIPYHQEAPGCRIFFRREELDTWMAASRRGPRT